MFGSQVLETAIGLALMFFILATAASAFTESISRIMRKRSKDLEKTIAEMFTKRADTPGFPFKDAKTAETQRNAAIPFMDMIKNTSIWQAAEAAAGRTTILRRKVGNSYLSAKAFADAIDEVLRSERAQDVADALPESLRKRLKVLEAEAKRGIVDVKAGLESWFDETMGRAEGAYKRWAALVLFFVGLAFAVLGNASAVDVARNLWQDPVTREAVAEAATGLVDEEGKPAEPSTPPAIGEVPPSLDADGDGVVSVAEATDRLGELSLPVGWDIDGADDLTVDGKVQTHDNNGLRDFFTDDEATESDTDGDGERIPLTALGWLVTALLVMLGGPFWFDLLTRLVALRGSGRKPPTAAEDDTSATSLTVGAAISRPAATALPVLGQAERDAELLHLTTMLAAAPATAPPAKRAVKKAP